MKRNMLDMRREIAAAVSFLETYVKRETLGSHKMDLFVESLDAALREKFKGHWYPENPSRGQAYRCIRVNRTSGQDPVLLQACQESGLQYSDLDLPLEFTLWVDPGEVCYRNMLDMRREIAAAVSFLETYVVRREKLGSHKVDLFVESLDAALQEKFKGHWYPENPSRGQAYRCIRVNQTSGQDPVLLQACQESGLQYSDLDLPLEFTLWVDPGEVCYRFGEEDSSICPVESFSKNKEDDKDVATVTGAPELMTSGSSSDEESTYTSFLTVGNCPNHQLLNPNAPSWFPEKMDPRILPPLQCSHRPHGLASHTLSPPEHSLSPVMPRNEPCPPAVFWPPQSPPHIYVFKHLQ